MSTLKHSHKLKRHTYKNGTTVYFCVLDCDYKISTELSLGKKTICWRCGKEFSMNTYSITLAKPHCESCHVFKKEISEQRKKQRRITDTGANVISREIATNDINMMRERLSNIGSELHDAQSEAHDIENDEDLL